MDVTVSGPNTHQSLKPVVTLHVAASVIKRSISSLLMLLFMADTEVLILPAWKVVRC